MDKISVLIVDDHPVLMEGSRGAEPILRTQRLSCRYHNRPIIPADFIGVGFLSAEALEGRNEG